MTRSLLGPINDDSLYRLHLWGRERQANSGGGGMDEYIGRTAHVRKATNKSVALLLVLRTYAIIRAIHIVIIADVTCCSWLHVTWQVNRFSAY